MHGQQNIKKTIQITRQESSPLLSCITKRTLKL